MFSTMNQCLVFVSSVHSRTAYTDNSTHEHASTHIHTFTHNRSVSTGLGKRSLLHFINQITCESHSYYAGSTKGVSCWFVNNCRSYSLWRGWVAVSSPETNSSLPSPKTLISLKFSPPFSVLSSLQAPAFLFIQHPTKAHKKRLSLKEFPWQQIFNHSLPITLPLQFIHRGMNMICCSAHWSLNQCCTIAFSGDPCLHRVPHLAPLDHFLCLQVIQNLVTQVCFDGQESATSSLWLRYCLWRDGA